MNTYYQEYGNQNEHRKYPFTDNSTMLSNGGQQLGVDVIIDAMVYLPDVNAAVYVSLLDMCARMVELRTAAGICATGSWEAGAGKVDLYDASGYLRHVGVLVFGNQNLTAETPMVFESDATTLLPACSIALTQLGVRGFVTDDDKLTTGDITLQGRNGVEITSYYDAEDRAVIRVDVYGCPPPAAEDCDSLPAITHIKLENRDCTMLVASPGAHGVINIVGAPGFVADGLCGAKRVPAADGALPGETDVCAEDSEDEPATFECIEDTDYDVPIFDGRLIVVAPSTLDADNPVKISNTATPGESPGPVGLDGVHDSDIIQRRIKQLWESGIRERGLITLKLKRRDA
jgi:hypothetical protein